MAKNEDWKKLYEEDWAYVSSMTRFFKWWIEHEFNVDVTIESDILPIIPGRIFDRPSIAYLLKDHSEGGNLFFIFISHILNLYGQIVVLWMDITQKILGW